MLKTERIIKKFRPRNINQKLSIYLIYKRSNLNLLEV